MPRDPNRALRMESEIQRVVAELLRREVKDPRVGSVTVTAVRMSPDLGHAKIYYLPFARSGDAKALQAGLDGAARFLRGHVGRSLKLRVAPELHFEVDQQLSEGMRLTEIIDAAVARDRLDPVSDAQTDTAGEGRGDDEAVRGDGATDPDRHDEADNEGSRSAADEGDGSRGPASR